jgi:hypothetical protein
MEAELEMLRREKDSLEQMSKVPVSEAIKQTEDFKEIERAKQFYASKNAEVEQLIQQVMTGGKAPAVQKKRDLKPESVESLLKFLTHIVLNQEQTSSIQPEGKSLFQMLKADD